jgi:hypothetical protein
MRTKDIERTLALISEPHDEDLHEELHADFDGDLNSDIKRIMACTSQLVECALQANWLAVLEGIDARRKLLQSVVDAQDEVPNPQLHALCESVSESERALMRVVAHAIASSRTSGGLFSLYH